MTDTAVVWFRCDLRVHDNAALAGALAADHVLPVYCFDPREFGSTMFGSTMFGFQKTGPHRTRFLTESVRDLRESLRERGGDLLVRRGKPEEIVPELAAEHGAGAVRFETHPSTEERAVEGALAAVLGERDIAATPVWGKTLHHIEDLPTPVGEINDTFTPWRQAVENYPEPLFDVESRRGRLGG